MTTPRTDDMSIMVSAKELVKEYPIRGILPFVSAGAKTVVEGVSFDIHAGKRWH